MFGLRTGGEARFWARPWRLQAGVVHSWRAHREGMHACAAAPSEDFVVSAGRAASSGREADVLRVWDLATSTAGQSPFDSCIKTYKSAPVRLQRGCEAHARTSSRLSGGHLPRRLYVKNWVLLAS